MPRIVWNWHCVAVGRLPLGSPWFKSELPYFWSSFLQIYRRRHQKSAQLFGLHLLGRPVWSFWFPLLTWPRPGSCSHLGNKSVDGKSPSLTLPVCHCVSNKCLSKCNKAVYEPGHRIGQHLELNFRYVVIKVQICWRYEVSLLENGCGLLEWKQCPDVLYFLPL